MFNWHRMLVVLGVCLLLGLVQSPSFTLVPTWRVVARTMFVGLAGLVAFGIFEQWPRRLPKIVARWGIQVFAVAVAVPFAVLALYAFPTQDWPFWRNPARLTGYWMMTSTGMLVAPWIAVAAIFRQRERERGELERKALDARLRLLQSQVEPHFLFNTLANVRELVDSGSPQATRVLDHLITYLRAAVPRLHDPSTTVEQETQLVRSYLELMHMRMPDRLQFGLQVDEEAKALRCPPTLLLTLVENAVRHGIDPSEDGGRIDVCVCVRDGRCIAEVRDTGVGLREQSGGLGTGLAALRERLQLVFGPRASLRLSSLTPRGVSAQVEFPAEAA
jgi:signal transduction histidine kinase